MTAPSQERFKKAMRQFPAAVNLITCGEDDTRAGLTATAVMPLSAEPPQIAVAVNRTASSYDALRNSSSFCVNTLAAHSGELARWFAGGAKGIDRFSKGAWCRFETGAPALTDALINLDCRIAQHLEFATHTLFVGDVEHVHFAAEKKPLLFVDGDWASLVPGVDLGLGDVSRLVEASNLVADDAVASSSDPSIQLETLARRFALLNISAQSVVQTYLHAEIYVPLASLAALNASRRVFDEKIKAIIERGMADGIFAADDSRLAGLAITGMMAWLHRWYRSDGRLNPEEIASQIAKLVLRAIRKT
jgi:flavin reductase